MAASASERLKKTMFVFLLVRPFIDGACDLTVDAVSGSVDLSAKITAKNESVKKAYTPRICFASKGAAPVAKWRLLMGFYVNKKTWFKKIKPNWSVLQTWETAMLRGLQFAEMHSVGKKLYVSTEARSSTDSLLLKTLQRLCGEKDKFTAAPLWQIIGSNRTHVEKLNALHAL